MKSKIIISLIWLFVLLGCALTYRLFDSYVMPKLNKANDKRLFNVRENMAVDWDKFVSIGNIDDIITFVRGSSDLSPASQQKLADLSAKLKLKEVYLLEIRSIAGDEDLARSRANAVADWLVNDGIEQNRMKVVIKIADKSRVEFTVGESR